MCSLRGASSFGGGLVCYCEYFNMMMSNCYGSSRANKQQPLQLYVGVVCYVTVDVDVQLQ